MTRIRVYIATTEGPVAVQKITAEDPDVPSVACRDGTTEVLAISRDYTRFVDRGTGLVAALTGHGAYRLDLDRPVDGGRSWQLPVLLAHLLEAEGRLAGPDDPADLVLLATGEVDRNQRVRPVGRIGEKLAAAEDLIAGHGENGPPLAVLLPVADRTPGIEGRIPGEGRRGGGGGSSGGGDGSVRVLAWERIRSLSALEEESGGARSSAGPSGPDRGAGSEDPGAGEGPGAAEGRGAVEDPAHGSVPESGAPRGAVPGDVSGDAGTGGPVAGGAGATRRRRRGGRVAGVLLLLLAAAGLGTGAAWWNGPRHWEALRRAGDYEALERAMQRSVIPILAERYRTELVAAAAPAGSLVFSLVEQRTADGRPCAARFVRGPSGGEDRTNLLETPVAPRKPGFFQSERGANLCMAVYRVANEGDRLVYLYFAVRPALSIAAGETSGSPIRRAAALPAGASLTLDLELGDHPERVLGAHLLILAAPSPAPQIRRAFERATGGDRESRGRPAGSLDLTALPALGLTVKGASHAILR